MVKHNDAGSMTVKKAVKISAKVAALITVLYLTLFFVSQFLYEAGIRELLRFFIYNIPIFPNAGLEDLNQGDILNMSRTVLVLDIIFISIALYLKSRKKQ